MAAELTLSPEPTAADDADLLARWTRSHAAPAFEAIVRRHIDLVYTTALRNLGDRHLADDVTQAVFLILSDKAATLRPGASLPAWLHQTTRYAAANARKLQNRRRRHERAAAQARPETVMPPETAESHAVLSLLDDAIGSLGSADRALVVERYLKGVDVAALAERSGATPRATQKRIERAVDRLRKYFGSRGVAAANLSAIPLALEKLSASSVGAAPAHLVAAASSVVPPAAAVSSLVAETLRTMIWLKLKIVFAIASVTIVAIATPLGVGLLLAEHPASTSSTTSPSASTQPATAPAVGKFEARLASGPTIELVGVCESPSAGKAWWKPDGSPLAEVPYTKAFVHLFDQDTPPQKGHVLREFALKVHPRLGRPGMERDWSLEIDRSGDNTGSICNPVGDGSPYLAMAIDPVDRPVTLRFLIASGPWKSRVITGATPTSDASAEIGDGATKQTISVTHPTTEGGQTRVGVTVTQDGLGRIETRMVATDRNGGKHAMSYAGGRSTKGEMLQQNFGTELPVDQIASFEFQLRPLAEWVEFRDVSLHAGELTKPRIVTSDDQAIRPGGGIGKVELGITMEEVVARLGEPSLRRGARLEYHELGLAVLPQSTGNVGAIFAEEPTFNGARLTHRFDGHTGEGLGLDSTREQIVAAYGPGVETGTSPGSGNLAYSERGITFVLQNGKATSLYVTPVKPRK